MRTMPSEQEESARDSSLWQRARIIIWPDAASGRMQAACSACTQPDTRVLTSTELVHAQDQVGEADDSRRTTNPAKQPCEAVRNGNE